MIKISVDTIEKKVAVVVVEVGIDDTKQYYRRTMMRIDYLIQNPDVDVDKYLMVDDHALMLKHVQYFYNENSHVA
jgi:vacuolar-type H+-ATPase catalytic subunit A/Vma1